MQPGSDPRVREKAAGSEADYAFLDCEDAVAPTNKGKNIIEASNCIDWRARQRAPVSIRIVAQNVLRQAQAITAKAKI
ncbi:MAG: hypothetical protein ACREVK_10570 [Gammaproteobacteria bacterium]